MTTILDPVGIRDAGGTPIVDPETGEETGGFELDAMDDEEGLRTIGSDGDDTIIGSITASNVVDGGGGDDTVTGGDTDDTLLGGEGSDTTDGGGGDDSLLGWEGADVIDGGDGVDTLEGGTGNDTIFGGADRDFLLGDTGNDSLEGQAGDDFLLGQAGDDTLRGGTGEDRLTGGSGADTFEFFAEDLESGVIDTITDFTRGQDTIRIDVDDPTVPVNQIVEYDASTGFVTLNGETFLQLDPGLNINMNNIDEDFELF